MPTRHTRPFISTSIRSAAPESVLVPFKSDKARVAIPQTPDQQVQQAVAAVDAAWRAGVKLQRLELLLPLIGATDLDDWPGGCDMTFVHDGATWWPWVHACADGCISQCA